MDYQALLTKYIRYVGRAEGTDFITEGYTSYGGDQQFTPEEWAALEALSAAVLSD